MKTCTKCGEEKSFESFYKSSRNKSGRRPKCILCEKAEFKVYRTNNLEEQRKRERSYTKKNLGIRAANNAKRHATKLNATPSWANLEQIKRIYAACAKITERTGIEHHVDHIIPLQGENVCGLHVENNLAIIPAKMNLQKSNKY